MGKPTKSARDQIIIAPTVCPDRDEELCLSNIHISTLHWKIPRDVQECQNRIVHIELGPAVSVMCDPSSLCPCVFWIDRTSGRSRQESRTASTAGSPGRRGPAPTSHRR